MPKKKASLISKQKSISDARKVRIPALICADFFRARAQPKRATSTCPSPTKVLARSCSHRGLLMQFQEQPRWLWPPASRRQRRSRRAAHAVVPQVRDMDSLLIAGTCAVLFVCAVQHQPRWL